MYSKTTVNSYARGVTPKRTYRKNVGGISLAQSLLSGEVMSRAKEWGRGKRTKLAKRLHNPIKSSRQFGLVLAVLEGRSHKFSKDVAQEMWDKTSEATKRKYAKELAKNRNPSGEPISPEVEDMSKSWHGRDVGDITEVEETESFETDLVELGDLEELGILELGTISFKKDQPKLCCDASGHNLEVVSGDQTLDLKGEGIEWKGKRLIPLGYLYSIVYVTDKMHLEGSNGYPEPYEHYLAEDFYKKHLAIEDFDDDTDAWFEELQKMGVVDKAIEKGLLPTCVYDKTDSKILIAGGNYTVTELGLKD